MVAVDIRQFAGQRPRISDRLIKDQFSGRTLDVDVEDFTLRPAKLAVDVVGVTFNSEPLTLVPKYSAPSLASPDEPTGNFDGWFWLEHVSEVAINVVPGDIYNRIYFQDNLGNMRITDGDNITLSGTAESPTTDYPLGVPSPFAKPGVTLGGTPAGSPEDRTYVYTFVDAWGAEGPPSPVSDIITVEIGETVTVDDFDQPLSLPGTTTPALAGLGAGNLSNGVYKYKVTFVTADGETIAGAESAGVTVVDNATDGQISLTAVPVSTHKGVTARKLYRTEVDGTVFKLLDTIADNTTTTYTDNTADGSLGANEPSSGLNIYNMTGGSIRIYRTVTGSNATDFQFAQEITLATSSWVDSLAYEELGEILPTRELFAPPEKLEGFIQMANGILAGWKGNTVYFTARYLPHGWPPAQTLAVPEKIVALAPYGQSLVVLTNARPYLVTGTLPEAPAYRPFEINEPCINRDSVQVIDNAVYYASPNGLIRIQQNTALNITESAMTRAQWEKITATDYTCTAFNDHYLAFYDTGESADLDDPAIPKSGAFMLRPRDYDFLFFSETALAVSNRPDIEKVYMVQPNGATWKLQEWNSSGDKEMYWRSKDFALPRPINFSCAQILADEYPVSFSLYGDGTIVTQTSIYDDQPFRLPASNKYTVMHFEIEGDNLVHQVSIAQTLRELKEL